ncbi:DUF1800 family protein [Chitiniphilus purpureus]|uniref:DUF1800 family protein n=1 Tax=Chitiniphilus purpureus TaxID=2981137 RepID=A0ABY6DM04_9NEIS|nr:DUF1800 family protein [Chitiniphilus sp. CD1]UXY15389.1 DUF1800 family protein [Chitiniphilus sp. CD1]
MAHTLVGAVPARVALAGLGCAIVLGLASCGGGGGGGEGGSGGTGSETPGSNAPPPAPVDALPAPPLPVSSALPSISRMQWNETAVRNILRTFAYGSNATDAQIAAWAAQDPHAAIVEMLTFTPFNSRLSPALGVKGTDPLRSTGGTLAGLSAYWSGAQSPLLPTNRTSFSIGLDWGGLQYTGLQAGATPGLNPFLHRVLFWETNYHLVTNQEAGVARQQIGALYDTLLKSLSAGETYSRTLARAAMSAAVARQYGHLRNTYDNVKGVFRGNEDFAREFHQLFFGILGTSRLEDVTPRQAGEDSYHEVVTIKNTAKVLTGMTEPSEDAPELVFDANTHHRGTLEVLHAPINGATAREKLFALAEVAIRHADSEDNLPVKIISGLANDRLTSADIAQLRAYWKNMGQDKRLLDFLRTYAISQQFHRADRLKYLTPLERNMIFLNRFALSRQDSELVTWFSPIALVNWEEGFVPFSPVHNVFGHETGEETSVSADHFRTVYNRSIDGIWRINRVDGDGNVELTAQAPGWEKNWRLAAPTHVDRTWRTAQVAEWLWQRFIGGLTGFGNHERLYVYSLLGSGRDAGFYCTGNGAAGTDPEYVFRDSDFLPGGLGTRCLSQLADQPLALAATDTVQRRDANRRIAYAIAFLSAIPHAHVARGE